jgi:hypothetical protein
MKSGANPDRPSQEQEMRVALACPAGCKALKRLED